MSRGLKAYAEGTYRLIIHVSFRHMHKQKYVKPLWVSVFLSLKWRAWVINYRQVKPLHLGKFIKTQWIMTQYIFLPFYLKIANEIGINSYFSSYM